MSRSRDYYKQLKREGYSETEIAIKMNKKEKIESINEARTIMADIKKSSNPIKKIFKGLF